MSDPRKLLSCHVYAVLMDMESLNLRVTGNGQIGDIKRDH